MTEPVDLPLEHVTVEPRAETGGPAPAAFVMHGRGADEQDLLPVARKLPEQLRIVSFRAPDRLRGGYTWYELDLSGGGLHQSQPDAEDFRRSLELVHDAIDEAVEAYDLDPDRLGLLGFSQGGIVSFSVLLERSERIAWVVGLHSYLAASHADAAPDGIEGTPVFVGAGAADQIIPPERAERAADRFRELGCAVEHNVYDVGHGIGPQEMADVVDWVSERVAR